VVHTSVVELPAFGTVGSIGTSNPGLIRPSFKDLDLSLAKIPRFEKERYEAKVMLEIFNATNTPEFGLPDANFSDPTFGQIYEYAGVGSGFNTCSRGNGTRIGQVSLHFAF
jgi:hypothetical protein